VSVLLIIAAILCAYLLGSIPSAYIVGRLIKKTDIREVGSKNMGAMNTFYSVGFKSGLLVLTLDICKGVFGVLVARWLGVTELVQFICGAVVMIGHNFPVFLKFKGGKGGASLIGVLIAFMPWGVPIYLGVFLLLMYLIKFPTLSYGLTFLIFPVIGWLIYDYVPYTIYPLVLLLLLVLRYSPRFFEMRKKAGSWKGVFFRKSLKQRY